MAASCTKESLLEEIPPLIIKEDSTSYYYPPQNDSDSIRIRNLNIDSLSISLFADNSKGNQSAAVYGDYVFLVTKGRSYLYIYNLEEKKHIYSIKMEAIFEYDYLGSDLFHSNQASFGVSFYHPDDPFPLLYISQRAREDRRCFVEVFRIIVNRKGNSYSSIDAQLVQTIYFPAMTEDNSLGNVNCVIDRQNQLMYTYSRNNERTDHNYGQCKISCFKIPDVGYDFVYLEDQDILSSYMLGCSAVNMQGACVHDGILYIGQGYKSAGYIYLNVVDLEEKKLLGRIDLLNKGVEWEPEGCFFYQGSVMIAAGSNIWEINNLFN